MTTLETVDDNWLPHQNTVNALKKRGITKEQYEPVVRQFRRENWHKQIKGASHKFYMMFDKVHGRNAPKPDRSEDKAQAEARKQAFKSKSKDSKERIIDIKDNVQYQVGEEQLRKNLAMIAKNWGWTNEQCDKWLKRELEKDSKRKVR